LNHEVTSPEVAVNTEVSDEQVAEFFDGKPEQEVKEAPKEEEKQEEVKAEDKPSPEENYKKAMQEERSRRKQEQSARRELEAKLKEMEERFNKMTQEKAKIPEINESPVENLDARIAQFEALEQKRKEQFERYQQEQAVAAENAQILSDYKENAAEFKESVPDFDDAYGYFVKSRIEEFKSLGYGDEEAVNAAYIEEMNIARHLISQGKNPAEVVYNMAKVRGWSKQSEKAEKPSNQDEKLKMLAKGTQNAKLSTGASKPGEITLEALAEMSDDEFMENWDKVMHR